MNNQNLQTQMEDFVLWFLSLEELDPFEKQKFVNHLLEVGTLDEKAFQYMEYTLNELYNQSQQIADNLKEKLDSVAGALACDQIPEISLKENIVKTATKDMQNMVQTFKTDYASWQKSNSKTVESLQTKEENSEISRLKNLVGA